MPSGKTHLLSGFVLLGVALLLFLNSKLSMLDISFGVFVLPIFACLPDLDTASHIRRITFIGSLIGIILLIYLKFNNFAIILSILLLIILFLKHRGILHSILAGLLLSLPIYFMAGLNVSIMSFSAYGLHILLDGKIRLY